MNENEKKEFSILLQEHYGKYIDSSYCDNLADEMEALLDTKYRKPIKQWLHGYTAISDLRIPKIESGNWSLNEIASRLDAEYPNVPAAALLLSLYEEEPNLLSMIIPIADEECFADESFFGEMDLECTTAVLDKETECWMFLAQNTKSENMKKYQLWQVLLSIPELAGIVSYNHAVGTTVELWNDGIFHVIDSSEDDY